MKTHILIAVVALGLLGNTPSSAAVERPLPTREGRVIHGGNAALNKAAGDTIDLMGPAGSGAPFLGDFEAGWNGWTSIDLTQPTISHWQVSDYNQAAVGNLAAWCGDLGFASCNDSLEAAGGYGNSWYDLLAYRLSVPDPGSNATVRVTATLQYDVEPGYDYVDLSNKIQGQSGYVALQSWTGAGTVAVNENFSYLPSELVDGTDVLLVWVVRSDGGWSDEDCSWPTAGACQIDEIIVTTSQDGQADVVSYTDFQDGTFGDWYITYVDGVGDFAALWSGLRDLDPCATNTSRQVAFIDDGLVVPGTGGTRCVDWCYGPGGYIVNNDGGLAGIGSHLENDIRSPVMSRPGGAAEGCRFDFDVYAHMGAGPRAPAQFFVWGIRSADTDGSAGNGVQILSEQEFRDRGFWYSGGPWYRRFEQDVTDLMNPGYDEIQVRLGVLEANWWWEEGDNGTPAPYFDNVSVKVFPLSGPAMTAREVDLAQDNFPAVDAIDFGDLGSLSVRFDMARNIAPAGDLHNDPGDSLLVNVAVPRSGAVLVGSPALHYVIDANPVFDPYRTAPVSGVMPGRMAGGGGLEPGLWAFDLPDTGLLFPGDVMHYYFRAGDDVGGDIQWSTLPADLTGYGEFGGLITYSSSFIVHALPTIRDDGLGGYTVPPVLLWNDFADGGGEDEWNRALLTAYSTPGETHDIYYTNDPGSGVGNGLGGRTAGPALDHYTTLLYTAGDLGNLTLSNGDLAFDAGDDIGTLQNWLAGGNRNLLLTGDNLVSDLVVNAGAAGQDFAATVMGVAWVATDLRPLLGNQSSPLVAAIPGNPVIANAGQWLAYGRCPGLGTLDAVTARTGAVRLAEFTDSSGNVGVYPYAAATYNLYGGSNRVVILPYDLMNIYTPPNGKATAPMPARNMVLADILAYFGYFDPVLLSGTPPRAQFEVSNYPNPFNPSTRIAYEIKAPGHLSLKVFNVRGELVKVLVDRQVSGGGFAEWDGTNAQGGAVSSGVYLYEARMGEEARVAKMVLLK